MEFFRDISIASQPMQHSRAAAAVNRQNIYAAHNENGKAQIWFTFSPDDTQRFKIMWFALGDFGSRKHLCKAPSGTIRFDLIAQRPGAAALSFYEQLALVIKYVLGWNEKKGESFEEGGLWGVTKAYVRVVEEQARLTLHAHLLVWVVDHADISGQFNRALANKLENNGIRVSSCDGIGNEVIKIIYFFTC